MKGTRILGKVTTWCERSKMELSSGKTVGMMLKGRLSEDRQPTVWLGLDKLKSVKEVRYLGILWTRGMGVARHIDSVTEKAMGKVMRVVRMLYGKKVDYEILRRIYKGVYVAIVAYAAGGWAGGLNK